MSKKIKMTKRIPKITGLYLYKDSQELELVFISSDKDGVWMFDHPNLKGSMPVEEPICCYGPIEIKDKE
jgi:hypothetical protein